MGEDEAALAAEQLLKRTGRQENAATGVGLKETRLLKGQLGWSACALVWCCGATGGTLKEGGDEAQKPPSEPALTLTSFLRLLLLLLLLLLFFSVEEVIGSLGPGEQESGLVAVWN